MSLKPMTGAQELLERAKQVAKSGQAHDALQLCDRAALLDDAGRYGAALLRGTILLDLGDAAGALSSYDSVADPQVPDAQLDGARGLALFELARLAEAENALKSAVRGDPAQPRVHYTLGLIGELVGNGEESEHFRRARKLDPEGYPPQRRVSAEVFGQAVALAIASLGAGPKEVLSKVSVLVAELPNPNDLIKQSPPISPRAPCMVVGVLEASSEEPEGLEDLEVGILLFKRNIERSVKAEQTLQQRVQESLLRVLSGTFEGPATRPHEPTLAPPADAEAPAERLTGDDGGENPQAANLEHLAAWRDRKRRGTPTS